MVSLVSNNKALQDCVPATIMNAALKAIIKLAFRF